jgi:hypothetical protein
MIVAVGFLVSNCSTYSIKPDQSKNGVVNKTPDWYVEYDETPGSNTKRPQVRCLRTWNWQ